MKVIILEDETPAFNKISKYLLEYKEDVEILAWYRSIEEASKNMDLFTQCDLLLSDIRLLDGNSFELLSELELHCPIIFCTAYNQYLQDAFDVNGIAYLNKPYSQDSFNKAMQKFDQLFKVGIDSSNENNGALRMIEKILEKNKNKYKLRFSVKKRDGIIIKLTSDILFFQASGDFCTFVDTNGARHSINYKISDLENVLDPEFFFRINRSEIIHINAIQKVSPYFKNKMKIQLENETHTFTTSGTKTSMFRKWLNGG